MKRREITDVRVTRLWRPTSPIQVCFPSRKLGLPNSSGKDHDYNIMSCTTKTIVMHYGRLCRTHGVGSSRAYPSLALATFLTAPCFFHSLSLSLRCTQGFCWLVLATGWTSNALRESAAVRRGSSFDNHAAKILPSSACK